MKDHNLNKGSKTNQSTLHALDYHAATARLVSRWKRVRRIVVLAMAIGLIVMAWHLTQTPHNDRPGNLTGTAMTPPDDVTAFYRSAISPLLDAALERNRHAADRAIESLHERFDAHRGSVIAITIMGMMDWRTATPAPIRSPQISPKQPPPWRSNLTSTRPPERPRRSSAGSNVINSRQCPWPVGGNP